MDPAGRMRGPAAAAAPPAPSFSSVGPSARGPADSPLLLRAEVTSGFSGFSACAVPPEVLKCPLKRQPRRSSSGHSVSGSAQKGLAFRAEVASCRRGLVTWFHTLVALSFQRSVSENSLVAMDFSGQTGRVIENPAEAQSAALEEGHAWRVSRGRPRCPLLVTPPGVACRRVALRVGGRVLGGEVALRSPRVGGWHCGAPRECLATPHSLWSPGPQGV